MDLLRISFDCKYVLMNAGVFGSLLWNIVAVTAAWIKGES